MSSVLSRPSPGFTGCAVEAMNQFWLLADRASSRRWPRRRTPLTPSSTLSSLRFSRSYFWMVRAAGPLAGIARVRSGASAMKSVFALPASSPAMLRSEIGSARIRWPMPSMSMTTLGGSFFAARLRPASASAGFSPGLASASVGSPSAGLSAGLSGLLLRHLLFVALGRERRRVGLLQHRHVDAAGGEQREGRHVEAGVGRADVGAGGEVEVLAVGVEHGVARVAQAVGDLVAFPSSRE